MHYVLITRKGERLYFYLEACAEIYKAIHGGEVFNIDRKTGKIIWKDVNINIKYG